MNPYEIEIAKYERRLRAIEEKPSPTMLASNKLLYRAEMEENIEQLKAWREGKPFLAGAIMGEILRSFGDYHLVPLVGIADRLGSKRAEQYVDKVRAMGLPDYACDRTILFLPLAVMEGELPKPQIIVVSTGFCEVINDSHRTLARLLGVPVYGVDVPFEDPHQPHLDYVVKQLEGLIEWVEATLPGAKYDETRQVERQKYAHRFEAALHDIYKLRQHVPCPDHPRDVFREPTGPGGFTNPELITEYYESYRDELQERVKTGFVPVGEEKLRIVWAISGPYGSNIWDYLAERGVSVPYWHYGQAARNFFKPTYGDTTEFGRKLTPLEEGARQMMYNSWAGNGERWIKDTLFACQEFQADGLVIFEQTGCQPVLGLGQLTADRLEKEIGIPAWRIEGRMLLGRTERTEDEFMSGLEAFINLCFERKKSR